MDACKNKQKCDQEEKMAINMIDGQEVQQQISFKTNELNHLNKMAKEESQELKKLKKKAKEIVNQMSPIQKDYKATKNSIKVVQECVSQRKIQLCKYEQQICDMQKQLTILQSKIETHTHINGQIKPKKFTADEEVKLQQYYEKLKLKLAAMKDDNCESIIIPGEKDDIEGRLMVTIKEYETLKQHADELQETIQKQENNVHEITQCNSKIDEQIQKLEECTIPKLEKDLALSSQSHQQQQNRTKIHEQKKQEQLAANEEMSQTVSQDCSQKSKLVNDLKESLKNCKTLKQEYQKNIDIEVRLAPKIEELKSNNKQRMQQLSYMKKVCEKRTADHCAEMTN